MRPRLSPLEATLGFLGTLTCGYTEGERGRRLFMILNACFDDSGSEDKSKGAGPVFVLAGFVTSEQEWRDFSKKWDAELKAHPKIDYFKMREADSRDKQFSKFTKAERDKKVERLASIIPQHAMFKVVGVLWWNDYHAIMNDYKDYLKEPMHPYHILFNCVMAAAVGRIKKSPILQRLEPIFDEQGMAGKLALESFQIMKALMPPPDLEYLGGPPVFRDEKQFLPLQAGDMLAWNVRRFAHENWKKGTKVEDYLMSDTLKSFESIPLVACNLHRKTLGGFFKEFSDRVPKENLIKRGEELRQKHLSLIAKRRKGRIILEP